MVFTYTSAVDFNGTDSFVAQVSDGLLDDNITVNVTVLNVNDAPVIVQGAGPLSVSMTEDDNASWVAPELNATDVDNAIAALTWNVNANPSNGVALVSGSGAIPTIFTYAPNADFNGTDSFVVEVSDGALTDLITIGVTVNSVNDAPVINDGNATVALSATEDTTASFSLVSLTATDVDTPSGGLIWSIDTNASHGVAAISGSGASPGAFSYVPDGNYTGSDSFVVLVSDGDKNDTIVVNLTVNNVNDGPVINDGNATVNFTVIEDISTSFTLNSLTAIDVDTVSGLLAWSVDTNASHGVATVSGSGASPSTFSYLPDANFTGLDSFVVGVSDGFLTDLITVDLNVTNVNDPPHFTSAPVAEANQLVPYQYNVTAADVDGNATPLTLTATLKPNWPTTFVDNGDGTGTLSGTPLEVHLGDHNVTLVVSDGNLSASQSFTITVDDVNDPPVITQGVELNATVMEDNASTWTATLAATDVDDDDATLVWTLDSNATNGVATVLGTGPSPTTFTYVPNLDYNGSDSFVVRVSDWNSSDLITVNVNVLWVDDPPVITQGTDVNGTVAERREANATVAWLVQPDLNATDVDHNASFLTWSLLTPPANGVAEVNGTGAAPATFTYSPNVLFDGTDSFVVQVSDGNLTDTATVTVIVPGVNDPPVIAQGSSVAASMDEGGYPTPWQAPVLTATDPEGDLLTWSAYYVNVSDANGTASVSGTGVSPSLFAYAPNLDFNGTDVFQVRVADGNADGNDTDEVTVTVTITGQPKLILPYSLTAPVTFSLELNSSQDYLVTGGTHVSSADPPLMLFTDNVYVFENKSAGGGPLYIGASPGTPYVGSEVWGNGARQPDEYLVFRPTIDTPTLLYYYDANASSNAFSPLFIKQYVESSIFASDADASDAFGESMSMLGGRAIVGASQENGRSGAVYVYDRDANGTFVEQSKLVPADVALNDWFGSSVSLGQDFLLAGSPNDRDFNGSVYVYDRQINGTWLERTKLTVTPVTAIDAFGYAVSVSGNATAITAPSTERR